VTSPRGHMPPEHTSRGFRSRRRPLELNWSSFTHLLRAVRLSLERVGQSFSSIRAHGPEQCRARTCALHLLRCVCRERPPGLQSPCSCPSTPSPRLIRSKVSTMDLRRAPAGCSIRPLHRSKMQMAACSRGDASHGLFMTSRPGTRRPSTRHAVYGVEAGHESSLTHLIRAVRLSLESMGRNPSSI